MHERMLRILGGTLIAVTVALGSTSLYAEETVTPVKTATGRQGVSRTQSTPINSIAAPAVPVVPPGMSNLRELPKETKFSHVVVGGRSSGGTTAGTTEKLIYSNTQGRVIVPIPPFFVVGDDIATIAPDGCQLTRFTFQVMGNANLVSENRPYTVTYALYDTCPDSFPLQNATPSRLITGSFGQVTIDTANPGGPANIGDVVTVEVPLTGLNVSSKTSMWLTVTFDRDNCAAVGGTPALEGFSSDAISFPSLGCSPNFGGFPNSSHASFNIEIFGESTTCAVRHLAYRNTREEGLPLNLGTGSVVVDDIKLLDDGSGSCLLTAYEVAVEGSGVYDTELRLACPGDPPLQEWFPDGTSAAIPGTYKKTIISSTSTGTRIVRIPVDPPVLIPGNVSLAVKVNRPNGGPILTGSQASVGLTSSELQQMDPDGGCLSADIGLNTQGALQATLICNGPADVGACCDMFVKECDGGPNDGEPCSLDSECESPGLCNPPCREVPRVNCPFPRFGALELPDWVPAGVCDPQNDPFSDQINGAVCGNSACCFKDTDGIEKCRNLFERDCDVVGDTSKPRQWQLGQFCSQNNQSCPLIACLGRTGDCKTPHFSPGCDDSTCCSAVCRADFDDFCCQVEWDSACVTIAGSLDDCRGAPNNDVCTAASPTPGVCDGGALNGVTCQEDKDCGVCTSGFCVGGGADDGNPCTQNEDCTGTPCNHSFVFSTVTVSGRTEFATEADEDPLVCCHNGIPNECTGGPSDGDLCVDNTDCGSGICGAAAPVGRHTVWFKFVAEDTSVSIDTCQSAPPATDSLLSVFRAGDPSSEVLACKSLGLIGCNDDGCAGAPGSFSDTNSKLCVQDLVVGDLYYVMLSTKRLTLNNDPAGTYTVRFQSPCPDARPLPNDFCDFAEPVTDTDCPNCDPVMTDLTDATLQCPAPFSVPGMVSDQWFEYTATCTGNVTVDTCGSGFDTSLVVYEGCDVCPDLDTEPIAFNNDSNACGSGSTESSLSFSSVAGDCYRIRVGDQSGMGTMGVMHIGCSAVCPSGEVKWIDPPLNTVDAGRPWSPEDPTHSQLGINKITVQVIPDGVQAGGSAASLACWEICENNPLNGTPVAITEIGAGPDNTVEIHLSRPLTAHAATTIEYLGNGATQDFSRIITHPGNVDGGISVSPQSDIFAAGSLTNIVTRFRFLFPGDPPFTIDFPLQGEPYSLDIDRSGVITPLDLLDAVDLLNGRGEYPEENATPLPSSPICPN